MSPRPPRLRPFAAAATVAVLALSAAGFLHVRREKAAVERQLVAERAATAYERAAAAQKAGDYNAAREGYLRTLALDRRHADARAALVRLTAEAGATDEARHHLTELGKIVPAADQRLDRSRTLLAGR